MYSIPCHEWSIAPETHRGQLLGELPVQGRDREGLPAQTHAKRGEQEMQGVQGEAGTQVWGDVG